MMVFKTYIKYIFIMDMVYAKKQKPMNWGRQTYIDHVEPKASSEFSMQKQSNWWKKYQLIYADLSWS